jgi:hypothetical protein
VLAQVALGVVGAAAMGVAADRDIIHCTHTAEGHSNGVYLPCKQILPQLDNSRELRCGWRLIVTS